MGKDYHDMMAIISESSFTNLEIFTTPAMISLIKYKKDSYADRITGFSASFHIAYVISFLVYLNMMLPEDNNTTHEKVQSRVFPTILIVIMFLCNTWACAFDIYQFRKVGWLEYFTDPWNYLDMSYIIVGYSNLVIQLYYPQLLYIDSGDHDEEKEHHHFQTSKILSILFVIIMLIKSLFFIRMIDSFIKLVIMVIGVISDLSQFVAFYIFIMLMLSMILAILGVGNNEWIPNKLQRENVLQLQNDPSNVLSYPMDEYGAVEPGLRNFYIIMRYSLGDFSFYPIMFLK